MSYVQIDGVGDDVWAAAKASGKAVKSMDDAMKDMIRLACRAVAKTTGAAVDDVVKAAANAWRDEPLVFAAIPAFPPLGIPLVASAILIELNDLLAHREIKRKKDKKEKTAQASARAAAAVEKVRAKSMEQLKRKNAIAAAKRKSAIMAAKKAALVKHKKTALKAAMLSKAKLEAARRRSSIAVVGAPVPSSVVDMVRKLTELRARLAAAMLASDGARIAQHQRELLVAAPLVVRAVEALPPATRAAAEVIVAEAEVAADTRAVASIEQATTAVVQETTVAAKEEQVATAAADAAVTETKAAISDAKAADVPVEAVKAAESNVSQIETATAAAAAAPAAAGGGGGKALLVGAAVLGGLYMWSRSKKKAS